MKEGDIVAMSPISLMTDEEKRERVRVDGQGRRLADWSKDESTEPLRLLRLERPRQRVAQGKGAGGAAAKGKGASGKARGKGAGGAMGAVFAKMAKLSDEERQQLRSPRPREEEKTEILKKAGLTDEEEIEQMAQMRTKSGGGGGRRRHGRPWRRWRWRGRGGFGGGRRAAAAEGRTSDRWTRDTVQVDQQADRQAG